TEDCQECERSVIHISHCHNISPIWISLLLRLSDNGNYINVFVKRIHIRILQLPNSTTADSSRISTCAQTTSPYLVSREGISIPCIASNKQPIIFSSSRRIAFC